MKLTREELIEYVKEHGETEVVLTEYYGFPGKITVYYKDGDIQTLDGSISDYEGHFITDPGFLADTYKWLEVGDLVDVHEESEKHGGVKGLVIYSVCKGDASYKLKEYGGSWVSALYIKKHTPEEMPALDKALKELQLASTRLFQVCEDLKIKK